MNHQQVRLGPALASTQGKGLADDQEAKFRDEIAMWIDNEWLVPYDASQHGPIGAVLPLIAGVPGNTSQRHQCGLVWTTEP